MVERKSTARSFCLRALGLKQIDVVVARRITRLPDAEAAELLIEENVDGRKIEAIMRKSDPTDYKLSRKGAARIHLQSQLES